MVIYEYSKKQLIIPDGIQDYSLEELEQAYQSGYTNGLDDGYADGYADGLDDCASGECDTCYTEGFEDGVASGVTYQKSLLSSTTITSNGNYSTENGWNSINVNVPQTGGYTEQDLINAFNSGYTNGYNSGYTDGLNDCPECGDYSTEYLTIEALSDGTLYWKADDNQVLKTIEYSKNNGEWTSVTASSENSGATITTVVSGDLVRFRGNNTRYHDTTFNHYNTDITFKVYGNIMSLTYGDNFLNQTVLTGKHAFCSIFKLCTGLTDASNLILPATTLTLACYEGMFKGCTSLVTTPVLPATTLASYCYGSMFRATSVNYVKCLATDITATNCTETWLTDASSTGTFVKAAGVTWPSGNDGIPSGWTVQDAS